MYAPSRSSGLIAGAALLAQLLFACQEQTPAAAAREHRIRSRDLSKLTLGQSTPQDVERLFGSADERAPDGALTYRSSGQSATFRFADGVLSKICRTRS